MCIRDRPLILKFILKNQSLESLRKKGQEEDLLLYSVLHQLDQKIIHPHYDFKHLTEKYFEIGMKLNDFSIQLVKYCIPKVLNNSPIKVSSLSSLGDGWKLIKVRKTERGNKEVYFKALQVWRRQNELPCQKPLWLLVSKDSK